MPAEPLTREQQIARLVALAMPRLPACVPRTPHPRQAVFLHLQQREALFGGAAGGGKTDAILMAALQFVDVPGYHAIAFRRTYPELVMPGGLIPRSKAWLGGTDAKFNESRHDWTFPNGAVLKFGHIQHLKDVERHERGPDYQCIVYDELTTFQEAMYVRIVGSRLRRPSTGPLSKVPLRVRAGTNPGGEGHEWVKRRFLVEGTANGRAFVRSKLADNPSIDAAAYIESLQMLDPVSLARMLEGDWEIQAGGEFFDRAWFVGDGACRILADAPACEQMVRFWDCAATTGEASAYTAGCKMGRTAEGLFVILDMQRFRARPGDRDALIRATAEADGRDVPVRIEKEGGSGGVHQADDQVRMLAGWDVDVVKPLGDKPERAAPLARQAKAGNVRLVSNGAWIGPFLDEVQAFPGAKLKDQVDAASGAFLHLTSNGPVRVPASEGYVDELHEAQDKAIASLREHVDKADAQIRGDMAAADSAGKAAYEQALAEGRSVSEALAAQLVARAESAQRTAEEAKAVAAKGAQEASAAAGAAVEKAKAVAQDEAGGGTPWWASLLGLLTGGGTLALFLRRLLNAYDAKPFEGPGGAVATEAELVAAARALQTAARPPAASPAA